MILLYLLKHGEKLTIMREKLVLLFESDRGKNKSCNFTILPWKRFHEKNTFIYRIGNIIMIKKLENDESWQSFFFPTRLILVFTIFNQKIFCGVIKVAHRTQGGIHKPWVEHVLEIFLCLSPLWTILLYIWHGLWWILEIHLKTSQSKQFVNAP